MSGEGSGGPSQTVYGALIGGMLAVFGAVLVFSLLVDPNGVTTPSWKPMLAVFIGIGSAAAYLVAGMLLTTKLPWLSGAFLFAGGFTAIWAGVLSLSAEPRWMVAVAFGAVIALGIWLGWWRFGRPSKVADAPGDDTDSWLDPRRLR